MTSEELDKLVEHYHNSCRGGEYDYLDTDHLARAFKYVYNKAIDDFEVKVFMKSTNCPVESYSYGLIYYDDACKIAEQLKRG